MKNSVWKDKDKIIRVLEVQGNRCLVIDCQKQTMPYWSVRAEVERLEITNLEMEPMELGEEEKRIMHQRFTIISSILPVIAEERKRSREIQRVSEEYHISKQTVRKYLCSYLAYQNIEILAPKKEKKEKELTQDEKNMRWALNKFFYTTEKNTLKTAYIQMLKERYCDSEKKLAEEYPTFHQFRYFYRKTKNMQNFYISREGLKAYQRNNRPCVGDGVQEFASTIGTGMLDATVCDIYLVNESGDIVGRPILTACVDTYSSLCCGYSCV